MFALALKDGEVKEYGRNSFQRGCFGKCLLRKASQGCPREGTLMCRLDHSIHVSVTFLLVLHSNKSFL